MDNQRNQYFDVGYGVSSVALTTAGTIVVATTGGDYHGIRFIAGTSQVTILAYDNSSTATGNILEVTRVSPGGNSYNDRFNPVKAKLGIVVSVSGTGGTGVVFYCPKG
jgi:hypothetical protein